MDGILFPLSLEVALLQLKILEGCAELRSLHLKPTSKSEGLQHEKLLRDRETVKDVLRGTLIEVAENGEWRTLQTATEYLNRRESSALAKRLDQEKFRISLERIIKELNTKGKQWEANLQAADYKIPVIRDKINDDSLNVNIRLRYTEKWLQARSESLEIECNISRIPGPRLDLEQRVHNELLKAYGLQTKEYVESLEYWQQRYTTDITKMNQKLALQTEQLRITKNHRIDLQKIYELHEGEIRGWLNFKRERAARLAREERKRGSATRIQAWWRGVMVRRALGAFRQLRNAKKSAIKSKKKYSGFLFSNNLNSGTQLIELFTFVSYLRTKRVLVFYFTLDFFLDFLLYFVHH